MFASKQEAGVSDGEGWFYIMKEARLEFGKMGKPFGGLLLPTTVFLFSLGSCPRTCITQAPALGKEEGGPHCPSQESTAPWKFKQTPPTYPLSASSPLGQFALRTLCRWAQPQRGSPADLQNH